MGPKSWRAHSSSANKNQIGLSPAQSGGKSCRNEGGDGCLSIKCTVNGWGWACVWVGGSAFGPTRLAQIAKVLFTLNCRDPVNIHVFNNPECAARHAFWRWRGLPSPFDVLSLSDSLSGIFEDGIGDIFFLIYLIQPIGSQQCVSSPGCFVLLGVGDFPVRSSFPQIHGISNTFMQRADCCEQVVVSVTAAHINVLCVHFKSAAF